MNPSTRVCILGLGAMGAGMARRALGAGFPVTVYNRTPARAQALSRDGARVATSPKQAASLADVVISMVADDDASRALWLGSEGALAGAAPGTVLVESSTVSVGWVRELGAAAVSHGCELIDAPVTGSKPQAEAGELNFIVGGPAAALEKARPVLAAMSRSIMPVGASGNGALLKLVNNFLCGVQAASFAEALAIVERSGLDGAQAVEFLVNGAPGSPLLKTFSQRMAARDYAPRFVLNLMAKDLAYAAAEAGKCGIRLETAAAAQEVFKRAAEAGDAEKDVSAVVEQFRKNRARGGP